MDLRFHGTNTALDLFTLKMTTPTAASSTPAIRTGTTCRRDPYREEWLQVKSAINVSATGEAIKNLIRTEIVLRTAINYIIDIKNLLDDERLIQTLSRQNTTTPENEALKTVLQQKRLVMQQVWEFNERHLDKFVASKYLGDFIVGSNAGFLSSWFYRLVSRNKHMGMMGLALQRLVDDLNQHRGWVSTDGLPAVVPLTLDPFNP
ncbi:hypothetical protein EJ08DRAFT_680649 [Tothia fuscella]|uniref:Uncharacterized protein n=1 Tax=Tothia fuscella TaxID=1048955 RepID=A0A9P4NNP1_9PEZI|nr:hypothetical protein EJ08DRAFT_680649 [Tothia fuscella]